MADNAGTKRTAAKSGGVTLIQRFGSALNLNLHFHILMIDGVYTKNGQGGLRFNRAKAPTTQQLQELVMTLSERTGRCLEREGLLEREEEQSYLTEDAAPENDLLGNIQAQSITYRIAVGPQAGRKVMTVQTLPACEEDGMPLASVGGFSLHAGVAVKVRERRKLEKLCRYITRPSLSEKRLTLMDDGHIRYELKTPYRDGTTEVIYEPLDFIAKLSALVPRPRVNLTRYHGVLAPNSAYRGLVAPSGRGRRGGEKSGNGEGERKKRRKELGWAGRLKRVFKIDVSICTRCGGDVRIIAQIDDPEVIEKILSAVWRKTGEQGARAREPPRGSIG